MLTIAQRHLACLVFMAIAWGFAFGQTLPQDKLAEPPAKQTIQAPEGTTPKASTSMTYRQRAEPKPNTTRVTPYHGEGRSSNGPTPSEQPAKN